MTGCFLTRDTGRALFNDRYMLCGAKTILQPCFSATPCLLDIHSQLCVIYRFSLMIIIMVMMMMMMIAQVKCDIPPSL